MYVLSCLVKITWIEHSYFICFLFRVSPVWTGRVHLCKRRVYSGRMALWWGQRLQGLVRWGQLYWWERLIYSQVHKICSEICHVYILNVFFFSSFCLIKWVTTHVRAVVSSATRVTAFLSAGCVTEMMTARTAQTRTLPSVVSHKHCCTHLPCFIVNYMNFFFFFFGRQCIFEHQMFCQASKIT